MSDDATAFFADCSSPLHDVCLALRGLILEVFPLAAERLDRANRIVGYSIGPRTMKDLWCGIAPHGRHVNLQLANGALIDNRSGLIQGTGKRVRHVKLHSVADVANPELRHLLEVSLARVQVDTATT